MIEAMPARTSCANGPAKDAMICLAPIRHQTVRTFDEERGRSEVDLESRASDPSAVVHDDQRMPELVTEHHQVVEDDQHDEADRERAARDHELLIPQDVDERAETDDRGGDQHQEDQRLEDPLQAVVVEPLHQPMRALPFDRERLAELPRLAAALGDRVHRPRHHAGDVHVALLEEVAPVERSHEVDHGGQLHLTGLLEPLDHDLLDRSGPVHELEQAQVGGVEPEVEQVAGVRDHHVPLAPPLLEHPDLDVVRQLGAELGRIDQVRDRLPDVTVVAGVSLGAVRGDVVGEEAVDVLRTHVERPLAARSVWTRRWTAS